MSSNSIRHKIHEIIFEADTPAGKFFDVSLLILIVASVIVIMLETVSSIEVKYGKLLVALEWTFTILFTIEYALRIYASKRKLSYILSFYGLVDLISIIPTYLGLFAFGAKYFAIVRAMRLLRVFRVLKMVKFLNEYNLLLEALRSSFKKIFVFLGFVIIIIMIFGTLMYGVEGGNNSGFTNIPISIYWAIVTVTTVGYGDIAPVTPLGQFLSACLMIIGYAIIAVPTGIVGSEMVRADKSHLPVSTQVCQDCSKEGHDYDAKNCKYCGEKL